MMKFSLVLILVVASALAIPTDRAAREWERFKISNRKLYRNANEESYRKRLFSEKLQHIDAHNQRYEQGLVSYKLGINEFSDYTSEEMETMTHGLVMPDVMPLAESQYEAPVGYAAPAQFDWRDRNVIGEVKNQGSCGSCWAFASTGALEPQLLIKHGQSVSLSEQNLVDCVTDNIGCKGGWMVTAYKYIMQNRGIDTASSYPYEAKDGKCRYSSAGRAAGIAKYVEIPAGREDSMKTAVADKGPLAVAIDASGDWGHYAGGVFYNATCSQRQPTHAVTVVGYGTENGHDYWLVKNSWGKTWGQSGYIKMARNRNNNCGIANWVSYPEV